jgi:hypothetical protein
MEQFLCGVAVSAALALLFETFRPHFLLQLPKMVCETCLISKQQRRLPVNLRKSISCVVGLILRNAGIGILHIICGVIYAKLIVD